MEIQPAIFFGHGSPMNALLDNPYTEAWALIGQRLGKPKAILCVSAHWFVPGTGVTISTSPRTIHDFGGFPRSSIRFNTPHLVTLRWLTGFSNCCHLYP
jgi:4,5-DOPA dioxygenase extradiol